MGIDIDEDMDTGIVIWLFLQVGGSLKGPKYPNMEYLWASVVTVVRKHWHGGW